MSFNHWYIKSIQEAKERNSTELKSNEWDHDYKVLDVDTVSSVSEDYEDNSDWEVI